jgi:hypothetical protein
MSKCLLVTGGRMGPGDGFGLDHRMRDIAVREQIVECR